MDDRVRAELERIYQLVTSDAKAAAMASIRHREVELEEREAAVAAAMELCSIDSSVRAAFADGILIERQRVLDLIVARMELLSRAGYNNTVLETLYKAVEGEA